MAALGTSLPQAAAMAAAARPLRRARGDRARGRRRLTGRCGMERARVGQWEGIPRCEGGAVRNGPGSGRAMGGDPCEGWGGAEWNGLGSGTLRGCVAVRGEALEDAALGTCIPGSDVGRVE